MKKLKYEYNDDIKNTLLCMKDVISLKEFYWQSEKEFNKTHKRMYLLLCPIEEMHMSASSNFDEYVDTFIYKINYKSSDKRVNFHGLSITQSEVSLISYKREYVKNRL